MFKYRVQGSGVGKFWGVDPLADKYPPWGPYAFSMSFVINSAEFERLGKSAIYCSREAPNKPITGVEN